MAEAFWVMAVVSLFWAFGHIGSLIITSPRNGPIWKAMAVSWRGTAYRINFDIHRAFGLGLCIIMLMHAVTGASWSATFFGINVVQYAIDATTTSTPYAMDQVTDLATPLVTPAVDQTARALISAKLAGEPGPVEIDRELMMAAVA